MISAVDNGLLTTDLDANHFNLINVGQITNGHGDGSPPPGLVGDNDSRLTDKRVPLDGSVTNAKVAPTAAIDQSKINFNGDIPVGWLGTTNINAARGDLAEYIANKGQINGYASLDNTGKVPAAQLPDDIGVGTVTSVGVSMPGAFAVSGSPVTTTGTIAITWNNVADGSWFGNASGGSGGPIFNTIPLPVSLIPSLDASKITSGTIDAARLPPAVGVGIGHSSGAVPDPGLGGVTTDYLGRDMTYHAVPTIAPAYQPSVPDPVLSPGPGPGAIVVQVSESLA